MRRQSPVQRIMRCRYSRTTKKSRVDYGEQEKKGSTQRQAVADGDAFEKFLDELRVRRHLRAEYGDRGGNEACQSWPRAGTPGVQDSSWPSNCSLALQVGSPWMASRDWVKAPVFEQTLVGLGCCRLGQGARSRWTAMIRCGRLLGMQAGFAYVRKSPMRTMVGSRGMRASFVRPWSLREKARGKKRLDCLPCARVKYGHPARKGLECTHSTEDITVLPNLVVL